MIGGPFPEPLDGLVGQDIRIVALEGLAPAVDVKLRIEVGALALEADPVVKAGTRFVVVVAHVPLADVGGAVAGFLEVLGEEDGSLGDGALVVDHPVVVHVLAGQDRGPAGGAEGRADEGVGEVSSFLGEPVEGRGFQPLRGIRVEAHEVVAMVVAENEDNVWWIGGGKGREEGGNEKPGEEETHGGKMVICLSGARAELWFRAYPGSVPGDFTSPPGRIGLEGWIEEVGVLFFKSGKTLGFDGGILLLPSCGIEAGILLGDAGTRRGEPGIEGGMEFPDPWFFPGSEIILFSGVLGEVVEFVPVVLVVMDELPVPSADDGTWFAALVAIVRVVPEEVPRGDFFFSEEGDEAHTVHVLGGEGVKACQFEESGIEIRPGHRGLAGSTGAGDSWGLDVVGFADPALPLASLAATVGEVAGSEGITGGDASVVRGEDHDGLVCNTCFIEGLEDDADRVVHGLHHAGIDGTVLYLTYWQRAVDEKAVILVGRFSGLIPVFFPEVRRGLDRAMDRVEGEKGKERGVGLSLDEGSGVISEAQREGLALRSIRHLWVLEGRKESSGGAPPVVSADVVVETVVFR